MDQSPIGRTPRSNPVTYLKAFDGIRELFAATRDAQAPRPHRQRLLLQRARRPLRGLRRATARCAWTCSSWPTSPWCARPAAAGATARRCWRCATRAQSIDQVLDMTVHEAVHFFSGQAEVVRRLKLFEEIGLGLPAPGPVGHHALRRGGAAHQAGRAPARARPGQRVLYVLDEPTTGLHLGDINELLGLLPPAARGGGDAARHRAQHGRGQAGGLGDRPRARRAAPRAARSCSRARRRRWPRAGRRASPPATCARPSTRPARRRAAAWPRR